MLYSAFILMCLKDVEPSYDTCIIDQSQIVLKTEEDCMAMIQDRLNWHLNAGMLEQFEIKNIECKNWLEKQPDSI